MATRDALHRIEAERVVFGEQVAQVEANRDRQLEQAARQLAICLSGEPTLLSDEPRLSMAQQALLPAARFVASSIFQAVQQEMRLHEKTPPKIVRDQVIPGRI